MEDVGDCRITRRSFAKAGGVALAGVLLGSSSWGLAGCATAPDTTASRSGSSTSAKATATDSLTPGLIELARDALRDVVIETPLVRAQGFDGGPNVMLKLENLQKGGSFKVRGAYAMIAMLSDKERTAGIVACSAGNHALGVALASQEFGVPSTVFMPADVSPEIVEAVRAYGAEVRLADGAGDLEQAQAEAEAFAVESGGTLIPAYDDYRVMAGQGTIGLELADQASNIDAVVVPVGGGGLVAGIACALKAVNPDIAVYGVESEAAPSMSASLDAGVPTRVEMQPSIAGGIQVEKPGDKTFEAVQEYVDGVYAVTEQQIGEAIAHLALRDKVVAEGAGAASVAAVLGGVVPLGDAANVVCIVSGGNIEAEALASLIEAAASQ